MKIALTGGPSAGKTSIVEILYRNEWSRLHVVPEAASILFRGGFPRGSGDRQARCQQRAIYHIQTALEEIAFIESPNKTLVCDRGSLDGLAYWPGDEASYFNAIGSSMEQELARYDWVLHLDTAPPFDYRSTSIRKESDAEARFLNEKVRTAWRQHPRRFIVPNTNDFIQKVDIAMSIVRMILEGGTYESIVNQLNHKTAAN